MHQIHMQKNRYLIKLIYMLSRMLTEKLEYNRNKMVVMYQKTLVTKFFSIIKYSFFKRVDGYLIIEIFYRKYIKSML